MADGWPGQAAAPGRRQQGHQQGRHELVGHDDRRESQMGAQARQPQADLNGHQAGGRHGQSP